MRVQDLDTHREHEDIKLAKIELEQAKILMDIFKTLGEAHDRTHEKLDRIEHLQRHHTEEMFDMAQAIARIEKLLDKLNELSSELHSDPKHTG